MAETSKLNLRFELSGPHYILSQDLPPVPKVPPRTAHLRRNRLRIPLSVDFRMPRARIDDVAA